MKVKELIDILNKFDGDLEVVCLNNQEDLDEPNPKKEKMLKRKSGYVGEYYTNVALYEGDVVCEIVVL